MENTEQEISKNEVQAAQIDLLAYKKAYLHACKYVTDDVIGVLTGKLEQNKFHVMDAFPLFHTRVLAPTSEIAFEIIESYSKQNQQIIIGIYESILKQSDSIDVSEIGQKFIEKIGDSIKTDPCVLKIYEIEDLTQEENQEAVADSYLSAQLFQSNRSDQKLKKLIGADKGKEAFIATGKDILEGQHRKIIDFDNHFEDISLDFSNSFLNVK